MFRQFLSKLYRSALRARINMQGELNKSVAGDDIRKNNSTNKTSIVFAPHPDDETLGCGGTIAKKCKAGETVYVVVMTNGAGSHRHLMGTDELTEVRKLELRNATRILGVPAENVITLDFPDAQLRDHFDEALEKVNYLLNDVKPMEVFTTYFGDSPADHLAANHIVNAAIKACARPITIYEYPIWFWVQWPFAVPTIRGRSEIPKMLINSIARNAQLMRDMQEVSLIGDEISIKREAINAYKSQMTRLVDDPKWLTLQDVSNGEFIQNLLQDFEVFHKVQYSVQ